MIARVPTGLDQCHGTRSIIESGVQLPIFAGREPLKVGHHAVAADVVGSRENVLFVLNHRGVPDIASGAMDRALS